MKYYLFNLFKQANWQFNEKSDARSSLCMILFFKSVVSSLIVYVISICFHIQFYISSNNAIGQFVKNTLTILDNDTFNLYEVIIIHILMVTWCPNPTIPLYLKMNAS